MKPSPAQRAVVELERRSAAALWALHIYERSLARDRGRLIAVAHQARAALLAQSQLSGFACHVLASHTLWTAARASALASARRQELTKVPTLAAERAHWARCRRGLQRRADRPQPGYIPPHACASEPFDPWRA